MKGDSGAGKEEGKVAGCEVRRVRGEGGRSVNVGGGGVGDEKDENMIALLQLSSAD